MGNEIHVCQTLATPHKIPYGLDCYFNSLDNNNIALITVHNEVFFTIYTSNNVKATLEHRYHIAVSNKVY